MSAAEQHEAAAPALAEIMAAVDAFVASYAGTRPVVSRAATEARILAVIERPAQPAVAPDFDAKAVRARFEESFKDFFGRGSEAAVSDQLGDFWLDRLEGGRYEMTRVDDAWTGWLAAARYYAHIETLFRISKAGHEQCFAECQRLLSALATPATTGSQS